MANNQTISSESSANNVSGRLHCTTIDVTQHKLLDDNNATKSGRACSTAKLYCS